MDELMDVYSSSGNKLTKHPRAKYKIKCLSYSHLFRCIIRIVTLGFILSALIASITLISVGLALNLQTCISAGCITGIVCFGILIHACLTRRSLPSSPAPVVLSAACLYPIGNMSLANDPTLLSSNQLTTSSWISPTSPCNHRPSSLMVASSMELAMFSQLSRQVSSQLNGDLLTSQSHRWYGSELKLPGNDIHFQRQTSCPTYALEQSGRLNAATPQSKRSVLFVEQNKLADIKSESDETDGNQTGTERSSLQTAISDLKGVEIDDVAKLKEEVAATGTCSDSNSDSNIKQSTIVPRRLRRLDNAKQSTLSTPPLPPRVRSSPAPRSNYDDDSSPRVNPYWSRLPSCEGSSHHDGRRRSSSNRQLGWLSQGFLTLFGPRDRTRESRLELGEGRRDRESLFGHKVWRSTRDWSEER